MKRAAAAALAILFVFASAARADQPISTSYNFQTHFVYGLGAPGSAPVKATAAATVHWATPGACPLAATGIDGDIACATNPVTAISVTDPISSTGGTAPTLGLKFDNASITLNGGGAIQVGAFTGAIVKAAGATATTQGTGAATSLLGVAGSSAARADVQATADNQVFQRLGGTVQAHTLDFSQLTGTPPAITSLVGDVLGTGPGATTTTIAANVVTAAKIQQFGANTFIGVAGGSTANVAGISCPTPGTFAGNIGGTLGCTATIPATSVPLATNAIGVGSAGGLLSGNASTLSYDGTTAKVTGALQASSLNFSSVPAVNPFLFASSTGSITGTAFVTLATLGLTGTRLVVGHVAPGVSTTTELQLLGGGSGSTGWSRLTLAGNTGFSVPFGVLKYTDFSSTDPEGATTINLESVTPGGRFTSAPINVGFFNSGVGTWDPVLTFIPGNYDIQLGWRSAPATTDTGGWVWVRSLAGAPAAAPALSPTSLVPIVPDTTDDRLYVYNGGWKPYGQYTGSTAGFLKNNSGGLWTVDTTAYVPTTRTLTMTAPMTCGGGSSCDLSADRTIATPVFVGSGTGHATGLVPDPGASAGSSRYVDETGHWSVPPGTSGAAVTSGTGPVTFIGPGAAATTVDLGASGYTRTLPLALQAAPTGSGFVTTVAGAWASAARAVNLASDVTGLLPLANITPSGTTGWVLTTVGTSVVWQAQAAPGVGTVTNVSSPSGDINVATGTSTPVLSLPNVGPGTAVGGSGIAGFTLDHAGRVAVVTTATYLTSTGTTPGTYNQVTDAASGLITGASVTSWMTVGAMMKSGGPAALPVPGVAGTDYSAGTAGLATAPLCNTTGTGALSACALGSGLTYAGNVLNEVLGSTVAILGSTSALLQTVAVDAFGKITGGSIAGAGRGIAIGSGSIAAYRNDSMHFWLSGAWNDGLTTNTWVVPGPVTGTGTSVQQGIAATPPETALDFIPAHVRIFVHNVSHPGIAGCTTGFAISQNGTSLGSTAVVVSNTTLNNTFQDSGAIAVSGSSSDSWGVTLDPAPGNGSGCGFQVYVTAYFYEQ